MNQTMNETITLLVLIIPGFFGIATQKLFTGDSEDAPLSSSILKYFLYVIFSWLFQILLVGQDVFNKVLKGNILIDNKNIVFTKEFLLVIFIATLLGALWPNFIEKYLCRFASYINESLNKNPVFFEKNLINKIIDDNKSHFVEVLDHNVSIAKGYIVHTNMNDNSIIVKRDKECEKEAVGEETIQTLISLSTGITVREFRYLYKSGKWSDETNDDKEEKPIKIYLIIFLVGMAVGYFLRSVAYYV